MKKAALNTPFLLLTLAIVSSTFAPAASGALPAAPFLEKLKRDTTNWLLEECERRWVELVEIEIPKEIAIEFNQLENSLQQRDLRDPSPNLRFQNSPLSPAEARHLTYLTQPFANTANSLRPRQGSYLDRRLNDRVWGNFSEAYFVPDKISATHQGASLQILPLIKLLAETEGITVRRTHRLHKNGSSLQLKSHQFLRQSELQTAAKTLNDSDWRLGNPDESQSNLAIPQEDRFLSTLKILDNGDRLISIVFSSQANRQAAFLLLVFDLLVLTTLGIMLWKWPYRRKALLASLTVYIIIAFVDGYPLWFPATYPGSPHIIETLPSILLRFGIIAATGVAFILLSRSFPLRTTIAVFVLICSAAIITKLWAVKANRNKPASGSGGLFTNIYVVPPTFLSHAAPGTPRPAAKPILEEMGAKVDTALYRSATSHLIVRAEEPQMAIVEAIIDQITSRIHAQYFVTMKTARIRLADLEPDLKYEPGLHILNDEVVAQLKTTSNFRNLSSLMMRNRQTGHSVSALAAVGLQVLLTPDGKSHFFGVKSLTTQQHVFDPEKDLETDLWIQAKKGDPILYVRALGNDEVEFILFENKWVDPAGLPL